VTDLPDRLAARVADFDEMLRAAVGAPEAAEQPDGDPLESEIRRRLGLDGDLWGPENGVGGLARLALEDPSSWSLNGWEIEHAARTAMEGDDRG
jgi:hypothetical protein